MTSRFALVAQRPRVGNTMLVLGIETSCDDTGIAVVRDGHEILSNLVSSQPELWFESRNP